MESEKGAMTIPEDLLLKQISQTRHTVDHNTTLTPLVNEAVERGIYPATSKIGLSAVRMVECYGADWHEFREPLNCPHCGTDLRDHENGPPGKREIAMYDRDRDRTTSYKCPDCNKEWPR